MSATTREMLQFHTRDLVHRRWGTWQAAPEALVTTAHDPDATDEQAEAAALLFVEEWSRHPVYCKCARYGTILHTLRHRPELADKVKAFSAAMDRVGDTAGGIEGWYANYTGASS
ncbi:hypothetical protein G6031_09480 [Dietzia sp. CQ4]|uniref:hypothetical protein n=1 Tax=Dietzia sp. (strain CQ4) TaxID=370437 RepID=UPI0015FD45E3|nr:hypothetical protein [Dietzia sp. CQ4]MBB1034618.1 hypothetical protein [Dietzia sp. CQ4]